MIAIILAAGMGTRLKDKTKNIPKGMLEFLGIPLLEWQVAALREAGVTKIIIVTGYNQECIKLPNVTKVYNPNYAETNMVESLMCARDYLQEGFILSYSDIIFDPSLARSAMKSTSEIAVLGDKDWLPYWQLRLPDLWEDDLESFKVDDDGTITEIGKTHPVLEEITHRFIGLIKFSQKGAQELLSLYDKKRLVGDSWKQSGKQFKQGYMTDLLHELRHSEAKPTIVETSNGWMEFDELMDFQFANQLYAEEKMDFVKLDQFSKFMLTSIKER